MGTMLMRILKSPAFWVFMVLGFTACLANLSHHSFMGQNATRAEDRPSLSAMAAEAPLMREGSLLNELKGRFRKQGERYVFIEDGSNRSFKCLENICLQRVESAIQDEERKLVWLVSAKTTEFKNENFLILEKAVRTR
jgi:hypothetical protein